MQNWMVTLKQGRRIRTGDDDVKIECASAHMLRAQRNEGVTNASRSGGIIGKGLYGKIITSVQACSKRSKSKTCTS